jgi:uncharacterized membrane protein
MNDVNNRWHDTKPAFYICLIIIILMLLISAWAWRQIPAGTQLPVHWGINGQPDRYAGKFWGLFMMPVVLTAMSILLILFPLIEPRKRHLKLSMKAYNLILIGIILLMAGLHIIVIMSSLHKNISVDRAVPFGVGLLFIIIGNYMGKIRSNFFLGIKTPWTLSSELSWNKTHRLGGRLFILCGFLLALSALLFTGKATFVILITGIFISIVATFAYSYIVWKNDPQKRVS